MTVTYATAAPVMMQLGDFQFGINTAAYQGLARSDAWRWPAQERIGQEAALQALGPGESSITLDGVIYPEWRGGLGQLDAMRAQAGRGEPLVLVDGRGQALGMWVVESVSETQGTFAAGGVARRIEFSLQLKRFSAAVMGPVPQLPPLPVAAGPVAAGGGAPATRTRTLADSLIEGVRPLLAGATSAWRTLQASPAVAGLRDAAGAVRRCADGAQQLQGAAEEAGRLLAVAGRDNGATRIAARLGERGAGLRRQAESAERLLRASLGTIEGAPEEAVRAVVSGAECAGRLAALCRQATTEAARIAGGQG
ncbi:MAG: phage tail protein [Lautropia sp.]|nr:phage tail protein [Lautropia sp.]